MFEPNEKPTIFQIQHLRIIFIFIFPFQCLRFLSYSCPISWVGRAIVRTQGEAPIIEPKTSSPISWVGKPPFISHFMGWEGHHMHPRGGTWESIEPKTSNKGFSIIAGTIPLCPTNTIFAPKGRHWQLNPISHLLFYKEGIGG